MPRIILHIGTHKTATTSIQKFLKNNQTKLAEQGVFYPDYSLVGRNPHYAHLGMVNGLSGRHPKYSEKAARTFFLKVKDHAKNFDTTIISAEPFYRHVDNAPTDSPYYEPAKYWELRKRYIAKIHELFGEAEVVVVFRRQLEYSQSLYQEHVKVTSFRDGFREFCKKFWYHFAFTEQARAWDEAFPGVRAFSFDHMVQTGDIIDTFCRNLGVDTAGLPKPPRANEGLPVDLVIMKRMLHRTTENRDTIRTKLETLLKEIPEDVIAEFKHRSFFQSPQAALEFQNGYDKENEGLRPFLGPDFSGDQPIFSTGLKANQLYGDRLKPNVLGALVNMSLQT